MQVADVLHGAEVARPAAILQLHVAAVQVAQGAGPVAAHARQQAVALPRRPAHLDEVC